MWITEKLLYKQQVVHYDPVSLPVRFTQAQIGASCGARGTDNRAGIGFQGKKKGPKKAIFPGYKQFLTDGECCASNVRPCEHLKERGERS